MTSARPRPPPSIPSSDAAVGKPPQLGCVLPPPRICARSPPSRPVFCFLLLATFSQGGGSEAGELAGFVCGTLSQGEELSHESMHLHDADGATLCIHSVAVAEKFRRRGYATAMLKVCGRRCR